MRDIERSDIEFVANTLGLTPIADSDNFSATKLGHADLVEEQTTSGGKIVKITGVKNPGKTVTILARGSNRMMLDEAERSIHDALCAVRSLVKQRYTVAGGGAPETQLSIRLNTYAESLGGLAGYCIKAYARAFEVIPYTLAENAGLNPVLIVTELRRQHALGDTTAGINVKKGTVSNILKENVLSPLLVYTSAIKLATECVRMLLKIDDIVAVNRIW
jgi:T-complex protein 1 subunit delta